MIRRATASDFSWLVATGSEAYSDLGDYRTILPTWLGQPGVMAWVYELTGVKRGLAMLGFYGEKQPDGNMSVVADLLALAVAPAFQGQGVGKKLLTHVVEVAGRIAATTTISMLRLTVESQNERAQRLYVGAGFAIDPNFQTTYETGKLGIRMVRALP